MPQITRPQLTRVLRELLPRRLWTQTELWDWLTPPSAGTSGPNGPMRPQRQASPRSLRQSYVVVLSSSVVVVLSLQPLVRSTVGLCPARSAPALLGAPRGDRQPLRPGWPGTGLHALPLSLPHRAGAGGGERLTAWLQEVRGLTDAAAVRLGHPVRLGVRVPTEPESTPARWDWMPCIGRATGWSTWV